MPQSTTAPETKLKLSYISAAEVVPKNVRWLWDGFLPLGKITMVAGPGGIGKSTIAYDVASRVTTGANWPDGSKGTRPSNVLIWSAEDALDDVLVPRLIGANADLNRIRFPSKVRNEDKRSAFNPAKHMDHLCHDLRSERGEVRLLILDPIISVITGDTNQPNSVRSGLQPLADLAAEMDITILGITHLAKQSIGNPRSVTDSVIGSQAFTALPRMNWAVNWSQQHDSHAMVKAKQNITTPGGIKYAVVPVTVVSPRNDEHISTVCIEWGQPVKGTADDIFRAVREDNEARDSERQSPAEAFLTKELSDGRRRRKTELGELAKAEGISDTQLSYAKRKLGIEDEKLDGKHSFWFVPTAEAEQCANTPS